MDSNTCYLFKDILQNNCFEKKVAGKHNVMTFADVLQNRCS